jgi:hypothetical protein
MTLSYVLGLTTALRRKKVPEGTYLRVVQRIGFVIYQSERSSFSENLYLSKTDIRTSNLAILW